jgi:hypothetical protein
LNNQNIIHTKEGPGRYCRKDCISRILQISTEEEVSKWVNYFVQETQLQDPALEQQQIIR